MEERIAVNNKKIKKVLDEWNIMVYNHLRCVDGLSPNGKATDSDSVISRFESL